jgi:fluoride ion exporter CrcB/FEX
MEFVVIVAGLLVGRAWNRVLNSVSRIAPVGRAASNIQLASYVVVAVVTGVAIGQFELHALLPSRLSHGLSMGLIAGFASSSWFLPAAQRFYHRREVSRAVAYLIGSPVLVFSGLLGGSIFNHLELHPT